MEKGRGKLFTSVDSSARRPSGTQTQSGCSGKAGPEGKGRQGLPVRHSTASKDQVPQVYQW